MTNKTTWLSDVALPPLRPSLKGDIETEVVIVGGGLAGTMTAYLLAKGGKKVVVLEKKDISNSVTAYTTAWLNCVVDTDLAELVKMYEPLGAKNIWQSGMDAIQLIENIIKEEGIDCDFKRVMHYRYAENEKDLGFLKEEHVWAEKLGFETKILGKEFLPFPNAGSLEVKHQAKFHPIKFLIGLQTAAEKYGAVIFENTEAKDISGDSPVTVITDNGSVKAEYSIVATYSYFKDPKELFGHKGTYVSYVFEVEIPQDKIPEGLYEDERNPYHYFRIDKGEKFDRMILGGEDHRKEIPIAEEKNFDALESYLKELSSGGEYKIIRKWSGPILETIDGLPYIGEYSEKYPNRLIATGFSGNGMTYSAISGLVLTDIILKRPNPYINLYHAGRKTRVYNFIKKAMDFGSEFFGGAVRNFFK